MKVTITRPNARIQLAVAAKQRQAGAHGGYRQERRERRVEKQRLHLLVTGRTREGDDDA